MPATGETAACAVCTHPGAAELLQSAGVAVVLMGLDSAALGRLAGRLRSAASAPPSSGGGRVAVFVGDPDDPDDLAAALTMAEEQFGAVPVVVSSGGQARDVLLRMSPGEPTKT